MERERHGGRDERQRDVEGGTREREVEDERERERGGLTETQREWRWSDR